jgi:hypothetical protein
LHSGKNKYRIVLNGRIFLGRPSALEEEEFEMLLVVLLYNVSIISLFRVRGCK